MNSNMFSFKVVLLAVALLAVTVQSWSDGNLSGEELKQLYNSTVKTAEMMVELQGSWLGRQGVRGSDDREAPVSLPVSPVRLSEGAEGLVAYDLLGSQQRRLRVHVSR